MRYKDSRTAKKQGRDDHIKQLSPLHIFFHYTHTGTMEKDSCRGVVYLTVFIPTPCFFTYLQFCYPCILNVFSYW